MICSTGDLLVVDDRTGKSVLKLRHEGWTPYKPLAVSAQVSYTPDGKTLVSLGDGPTATVNVRDADTGQLRFAPLHPSLAGSQFSQFFRFGWTAGCWQPFRPARLPFRSGTWQQAALCLSLCRIRATVGACSPFVLAPTGDTFSPATRMGRIAIGTGKPPSSPALPWRITMNLMMSAITPDGRFALDGGWWPAGNSHLRIDDGPTRCTARSA